MTRSILLALLAAFLLASPSLVAQDAPVVFSTYYECSQSSEDDLDPIVMSFIAPIYDAMVENGTINNWGWSAHRFGGDWRRLGFFIADNREAGWEARGQIIAAIQEDASSAMTFLNDTCPSHDDYIWEISASAAAPADGGGESLTTYYGCNFAREARADELVAEHLAPVLDSQVEAGLLTGWSWLVHDVGGGARRAAVFNGNSHLEILTARDNIVEAMGDEEAMAEFSEICGNHTDYLWTSLLPS